MSTMLTLLFFQLKKDKKDTLSKGTCCQDNISCRLTYQCINVGEREDEAASARLRGKTNSAEIHRAS